MTKSSVLRSNVIKFIHGNIISSYSFSLTKILKRHDDKEKPNGIVTFCGNVYVL